MLQSAEAALHCSSSLTCFTLCLYNTVAFNHYSVLNAVPLSRVPCVFSRSPYTRPVTAHGRTFLSPVLSPSAHTWSSNGWGILSNIVLLSLEYKEALSSCGCEVALHKDN